MIASGNVLILLCLVGSIHAMGLDLESIGEPQLDDDRTIIITATNNTQLLALLALAAAGLLPLLCLCALSALLLWQLADKDDGYGSSYSQYKRALGFDDLDWEKLSIIDWVAMGEETYRKFDPTNLNCQTRMVCELHQNTEHFGPFARNLVQAIQYLRYLEVFSLPEIFMHIVREYLEAAERGRSLKKDCGDIYGDCDFSITQIYDTYLMNEIH